MDLFAVCAVPPLNHLCVMLGQQTQNNNFIFFIAINILPLTYLRFCFALVHASALQMKKFRYCFAVNLHGN